MMPNEAAIHSVNVVLAGIRVRALDPKMVSSPAGAGGSAFAFNPKGGFFAAGSKETRRRPPLCSRVHRRNTTENRRMKMKPVV